ncbi:hypothetical protein QQ965_02390 [Candidatus Saccharibacteria bacterium oral taxon 955]
MATTKKTTKKAATKRTPAKKAAPKRAPAKKSTTKVTRVSRPKKAAVRSLHPAKSDEQFMTFKITRQTVYWLVLTGIVLLLGLWVIDISNKIQHIYDQNDAARRQAETTKVQKSH